MKRFVVTVIWTCLVFQQSHPETIKQYRKDYEYNSQTDAFYKLHTSPRLPKESRDICKAEGAQLMKPTSQDDVAQTVKMALKDKLTLFVRIEEDDNSENNSTPTIQGSKPTETSRMITRFGEIETKVGNQQIEFICKVEAKDAYYDPTCHVYSRDYEYVSNVSSCYKVGRAAVNWVEARIECEADGADLVVLNSEAERDEVLRIIRASEPVAGSWMPESYFLGIRVNSDDRLRVFKTVLNQSLEESGFVDWNEGEPNNSGWTPEDCGSLVLPNGKFNDIHCSNRIGFICETKATPNM